MTQEITYKGSCPTCGGPLEPKLYVFARNADGTVKKLLCLACGGSGEVFEKEGFLVCSECGGTGSVDAGLIEPYCPTCEGFWRWTVILENEEQGIQPDVEDFPGILEDAEQ